MIASVGQELVNGAEKRPINVLTKDDKPKNIGQVECNSFGSVSLFASDFSLTDLPRKGAEFLGH